MPASFLAVLPKDHSLQTLPLSSLEIAEQFIVQPRSSIRFGLCMLLFLIMYP